MRGHMCPTISVEIPHELKNEIEESGIDVDRIVREALEVEVRRRRRERLSDRAAAVTMSDRRSVDASEISELVREDRAARDR